MNKPIVILYQAYGSKTVYYQVLFSILTLYYHVQGNFDSIQVVLYTDNKAFFQESAGNIPIAFEQLTTEILRSFKGKMNFTHRVKICIIQDCFEKYKKDVFYLDSDTYFLKPPVELFNKIDENTSIMNSDDYDLIDADLLYENNDWLNIRRAIKYFDYTIDNMVTKIPMSTRMWNAGIIGLSEKNKVLLEPILQLTDEIYSNRKVFTAEQFAFSYFLQTKTKLISSGDIIFHYWPNHIGQYWKDAYSYHIKSFFKQYKKVNILEKALLAYQLTQNHYNIIRPVKRNIIRGIIRRAKLIITIVKKGSL